jgi:heat shock protein HslJ
MKKSTIIIIILVGLILIALTVVPWKNNAPDIGSTATLSAMALAGLWIGPEGTSLTVEPIASTVPQKYRLNFVLLDGPLSVVGDEKASEIIFTRNFQPLTIRAGTGDETGMKYLLGKTNCIVVSGTKSDGMPTPPEGYCNDEPSDRSVSNPPAGDLSAKLNGNTYKLISMNGKVLPSTFMPVPTITFGPKFGDMTGKFCNGMGGTFTMKDFVIKAQLIGTQMACGTPMGIMEYESQFGAMLGMGAEVKLDGSTLIFSTTDGKEMIFGK